MKRQRFQPRLVSLSPCLLVSLSPCRGRLQPRRRRRPARRGAAGLRRGRLRPLRPADRGSYRRRSVQLYIRSLANLDPDRAERTCAEAATPPPLSVELHYLHGVLLVSLGRGDEAAAALRASSISTVRWRRLTSRSVRSWNEAATRKGRGGAYRNARDLCRAGRPTRRRRWPTANRPDASPRPPPRSWRSLTPPKRDPP